MKKSRATQLIHTINRIFTGYPHYKYKGILPYQLHARRFMTQQETIIRRANLPNILGISLATIDRLRDAGGFPKPVRLGEQAIGFTRSSIDEWLATRPACNHFTEKFTL